MNKNKIINFFQNELNCEYIPNDIIDFYSNNNDGIKYSINEIFGINSLKEQLNKFKTNCNYYGINYNENKFIPIANDGMGGYYAFSSNKDSNIIYYIDHEDINNKLVEYTLEEMLSTFK